VLAASIAIAFMVAQRSGRYRDRNDTLEYAAHYQCVQRLHSSEYCADEIGGSFDVFYYWTVLLSVTVFGPDGFAEFKFLGALFICFSILYSAVALSRLPLLTAAIILSDYRFLEYSANVLRHGLALATFMLAMLLAFRRRSFIVDKLRYLAVGFHFSALVIAIVPRRRVSVRTLIGVVFVVLLVRSQMNVVAEALSNTGLFGDKLSYYLLQVLVATTTASEDMGIVGAPALYLAVSALGLFLYQKIESDVHVYCCNLMIALFCVYIVFSWVGVSYRFVAFMLPFVAIAAASQIEYVASQFGSAKPLARLWLQTAAICVCVGLFVKNVDMFTVHLG
jgi:hypothetical protein